MKWFDQWFMNKCKWAWGHGQEVEAQPKLSTVSADHHRLCDGVSINLKQVIGGRLVTFQKYDRKLDHNDVRTYIITDEMDFNLELGKIITMESLR